MSTLAYAAHAYWNAATRIRRTDEATADDARDLVVILSNVEYPASLCRGAADAMHAAIDLNVQLMLSDEETRDLAYALAERDEMEEDRWIEHPHSMHDGEPEVCRLSEARAARNG